MIKGMQKNGCSLMQLNMMNLEEPGIGSGVRLAELLSRMTGLRYLELGVVEEWDDDSETAFMTEFLKHAAVAGSGLLHSLTILNAVALPILMAAMEKMVSLRLLLETAIGQSWAGSWGGWAAGVWSRWSSSVATRGPVNPTYPALPRQPMAMPHNATLG